MSSRNRTWYLTKLVVFMILFVQVHPNVHPATYMLLMMVSSVASITLGAMLRTHSYYLKTEKSIALIILLVQNFHRTNVIRKKVCHFYILLSGIIGIKVKMVKFHEAM